MSRRWKQASAVSDRRSSPVTVIIGMMGAGKTTIGREVGRLLGVSHVDSDDLVSTLGGAPAADQLRTDETAFRRLEADTILGQLSRDEPLVLSLGGGAPATSAVAEALVLHSPVVWIQVPEDELLRRILAHGNDRPMLDGDPSTRLRTLLANRTPSYESAASAVVDGTGTPLEVARRIVGVLS
jgi:shikimate kinase